MKLILPFPPSVNTYWRHPNKGAFAGKSLISAAGRKFQSAACAAIVEQLRRLPKPTSAPASVEIVLFPPDKHPCEKPADMLRQIINASSRPGDLVADFFMGSGSTIKAAMALGRRALGVELESERFNQTVKEINELVGK
ncbi:hypothetical protein BR148_003551 [Escherichia coli]|nr:hypothetical protein [Escherichia coli]